ncbi:hypothetical protein ACOMHN_045589 [Nucella lapillus]
MLLEHGADASACDSRGNTPLHWCGHTETIELLVEYGANVLQCNKRGLTPRDMAERRGVSGSAYDLLCQLEVEVSEATGTGYTQVATVDEDCSYRAAIESILCYGMESIPLTPTLSQSFDSCYQRMVRSALGIFYPDRISNDEHFVKTQLLSTTLRRRRLRLVGHILHMQTRSKSPLGELLLNSESGHLRRGQGRTVTLLNDITTDLSSLHPSSVPSRRKRESSRQFPSGLWQECASELGSRHFLLLVVGVLGFSLYIAFILTGLHLGGHGRVPIEVH